MHITLAKQPTIYVIHENDEWVVPLRAAFQELKVPHREWFINEGSFDLSEEPGPGVYYNRMSASSHSRGHEYAPELTENVLRWLESFDRRVVNNSESLRLEVSKLAQYAALRRFDIPTPRTVSAVGKEQLLKAAQRFPLPFITKHNRAGRGLGVRLFEELSSFEEYVQGPEFEPSRDGITLLQEYIKSPNNSITRVEFIGGEFLYAVRVDTSQGFQLCPADTCAEGEFCPVNLEGPKFAIIAGFEHPLLEKYQAFMKAHGIEVAAFEFITDAHGRSYTYDTNMNTNYNSAAEQEAGGRQGMLELARFLKAELARL